MRVKVSFNQQVIDFEKSKKETTIVEVFPGKYTKKSEKLDAKNVWIKVRLVRVKLPKNQHAILIINNDKVLSKTVESEQNEPLKLLYKGFPNINLEEFYFEVLSEKSKHFIWIFLINCFL